MEYYEEADEYDFIKNPKTQKILVLTDLCMLAIGVAAGHKLGVKKATKLADKQIQEIGDFAYNVGITDGKSMAYEQIIQRTLIESSKNVVEK